MCRNCGDGGSGIRWLNKAARTSFPADLFDDHGRFLFLPGRAFDTTDNSTLGPMEDVDLARGRRRSGIGPGAGRWLRGPLLDLHGWREFQLDAICAPVILGADGVISKMVAKRADWSGDRRSWLWRGDSREQSYRRSRTATENVNEPFRFPDKPGVDCERVRL